MSDLPYQCICGARYPRRGLALLCCSERLIKREVRCDGGQTPDTQDGHTDRDRDRWSAASMLIIGASLGILPILAGVRAAVASLAWSVLASVFLVAFYTRALVPEVVGDAD